MVIAGIVLLIMAGVCLLFVLLLHRIFNGEETQDMIVWGTILEYRTEDRPTAEKPVVSFVAEGEEVQAYADSIPVRGRPPIGTTVKLAVRREPIPGDENRWHAAIVTEEEGPTFIQKFHYGLTAVGVILVVAGALLLAVGMHR